MSAIGPEADLEVDRGVSERTTAQQLFGFPNQHPAVIRWCPRIMKRFSVRPNIELVLQASGCGLALPIARSYEIVDRLTQVRPRPIGNVLPSCHPGPPSGNATLFPGFKSYKAWRLMDAVLKPCEASGRALRN